MFKCVTNMKFIDECLLLHDSLLQKQMDIQTM